MEKKRSLQGTEKEEVEKNSFRSRLERKGSVQTKKKKKKNVLSLLNKNKTDDFLKIKKENVYW